MLSACLSGTIMQWLGNMGDWEAALTVFSGIVAVGAAPAFKVVYAVKRARREAWDAAEAEAKSEDARKAVGIQQAIRVSPTLEERLDRISHQVTEVTAWTVQEARSEVHRLQEELRNKSESHDITKELLTKAAYDSVVSKARIRDLERAIIAADTRAAAAVEELREHKRASTSGVSTRSATITPLRPPQQKDRA